MVIWEEVRHQVAIAGTVTDAQTNRVISGVRVEIIEAPEEFESWLALRALQYGAPWATMVERPDRTRTAFDGHFHFLDLPAGDYRLKASLPSSGTRYGEKEVGGVTVSWNGNGKITMATADLSLPPTTVKGSIYDQDRSPVEFVAMAEVRVKGSGERTFSDGDGQYILTGLETGPCTIMVSAHGYQKVSQEVTLDEAGTEKIVDFFLEE